MMIIMIEHDNWESIARLFFFFLSLPEFVTSEGVTVSECVKLTIQLNN